MPSFERWGTAHLLALAVTVVLPLLLAWWSRRGNSAFRQRMAGAGFAALLIGVILTHLFLRLREPVLQWQHMMPLHVCDLALFACALSCIFRWQRVFEIAYFWGLAGTLHGLITPDLAYGFPSLHFWLFFLGHGGIVGSVLYMVAGLRLRPQWVSVFRSYGAIGVYAVVAGAFNFFFATNYGYLCAKPLSGSLFDLLGPWPWYLVAAAAVGLVSFIILYLPWWIKDRLNTKTRPREDRDGFQHT